MPATDATITTADSFISNVPTSLGAGGSATYSKTVTLPATAGTYYIGVIADRNNTVAETNESNNTGSAAISVVNTTTSFSLQNLVPTSYQQAQLSVGNTYYIDRTYTRRRAGRYHIAGLKRHDRRHEFYQLLDAEYHL